MSGIRAGDVVFLLIFGLPILLGLALIFVSGMAKAAWWRWIGKGLGGIVLAAGLVLVTWLVACVAPWRTGILASGVTPEGREYCVVQSFQDFIERNCVCLYLRDSEGAWRWHYLGHDDDAWRSTSVEFKDDVIVILEGGKVVKRYPRMEAAAEDTPEARSSDPLRCRPASATKEEVAAFHYAWSRTHGF